MNDPSGEAQTTEVPDPSRLVAVPEGLPSRLQHFIGGESVDGGSGETFPLAEPVSNRTFAQVAAGDARDVDRAVRAARVAFEGGWRDLAPRARSKILKRVADGIESRAERLAEYESFDTGLPITQAKGQAARAAENFRLFADLIVGLHEDAFRSAGQLRYVLRRGAGVAGLITPWNTPFMLETWKAAPAMAAGCSVVLKPAEWTPLSASLLPEIMAEAGVPDGVFNMVQGIGEVAGAALVTHLGAPLISFAGETTTGQVNMRATADNLKALSMELGGKSPALVFADADLEAALDGCVFGVFSLNGERCTAGSRILVERSATTGSSSVSQIGHGRWWWAFPRTRGPRSARSSIRSITSVCSVTSTPGRGRVPAWSRGAGAPLTSRRATSWHRPSLPMSPR
jgi:5-carboxymethyl-2-hydroxymuconic-semialdehyde dehydrogenase